MYTQDYDQHLPPVASWVDATYPYVKNNWPYRCPGQKSACGYAFNLLIGGISISDVPSVATTPVLFDSTLGAKNGTDQLQSFALPHPLSGRYGGNVLYLDGQVKTLALRPPAAAGNYAE